MRLLPHLGQPSLLSRHLHPETWTLSSVVPDGACPVLSLVVVMRKAVEHSGNQRQHLVEVLAALIPQLLQGLVVDRSLSVPGRREGLEI